MNNKIHSFRIDPDLIKRIKILCAAMGITMIQFVNEALKKHLELLEKRKK
jgi:predicted DNA-binding protein